MLEQLAQVLARVVARVVRRLERVEHLELEAGSAVLVPLGLQGLSGWEPISSWNRWRFSIDGRSIARADERQPVSCSHREHTHRASLLR